MGLFLKNKLYRILTTSRILNSFSAYIYNMVFVIYAASQYQSNLAVAAANIIMVLPTLFSLWVGIKADHTKRKASCLIWTALVQAILFVIMALIINQGTLVVFSIVCLFNVVSDVLNDYSGGASPADYAEKC
ncbi:hypothetical protein D3X11_06500 [Streptococcus sp. X16XC17]|uniref:hypothetical protein n=1 Tax=Streptococcus sp. X16XC17 TaxID=2316646 RepID=UPI0010392385|nr:hypothetical protein [Streptococcus sp. X16XC17]TCD45850.1 hypothetical protein D3X11_06500 [Streptococcus sp. X16XC17]